jgi:drug/metabolite transporter (DMT)-like permease
MDRRALAYLVAANVLGACSYVATGYALRGFGSLDVVLWRTVLGTALLAPFLRGPALGAEDRWRFLGVGCLGYALPLVIGTEGQRLSSATLASILVGTEPVCIVLLSCLFLGEAFTPLKGFAAAAGLGGACLITLQGRLPGMEAVSADARGNLLLALHGFCWSLYTVIGKPALRRVDPLRFTGLTTAVAVVPLAVASHPAVAPVLGLGRGAALEAFPTAPPEALAAVVFLAVGVTFAATLAWNRALERVPATQLAHFIFLQPALGVVLGRVLEGRPLTDWSVAGAGLIAVGIWAANRVHP